MLVTKVIAVLALIAVLVFAFSQAPMDQQKTQDDSANLRPEGAKTLYVAGGCFWCTESQFEMLRGVYDVESGYAGGAPAGVSYEQVSSGRTGHAETVKITYDPKVVSAADLLRIFFTIHNPTTLNQQGPDHGTQYRSAIFYKNDEEKQLAQQIMLEVTKAHIWNAPLVTTIEPLRNWTKAEEYHQNYFEKYEHATPAQRMSMNSGYCSAVVEPHVLEFRHRFADRLKKK